MATQNNLSPLIVIVGETASGKSALALELAKRFNGEIITADSWTVYKGFNIGSAKPSHTQQNEVRHHLLDIAEPLVGFSAAEFKKRATEAINNIQSRQKLPIMVGGTGLYIDSVIFDYGFLPPGPTEKRAHLNELSRSQLLNKIKAKNINIDGIDIRNKRRLIRLLENEGQRPGRGQVRSNTLVIGLFIHKDQLEARIKTRVNTMISAGLRQEVKSLAETYGWTVEPMKGIGYREWQENFSGKQTIEQTKEQIVRSTLQLAKKQRTWFKRNKSIHWVRNKAQAVGLVTTFLNK